VSPEYSARQQYLPTALVFDVASEVAAPATNVFVAPTFVPAEPSQPPAVISFGWQRKKFTVPPGVPKSPDAVKPSVTLVPGTTLPPVGDDVVARTGVFLPTVKHSEVVFVWAPAV